MPEIVEALQQAGVNAIDQARRTGTKLIIWQNEKMIEMTPDEADALLKSNHGKKLR